MKEKSLGLSIAMNPNPEELGLMRLVPHEKKPQAE